jgi:chemotaxis protein CheD
MNDGGRAPDRKLVRVGVADGAVSGNGATLATSGLGSCVAIALYDTNGSGIGGLLHAMLPAAPETDAIDNPTKYVDSGLAYLLDEIATIGGDRRQVVAKFAGGSAMLDIGTGGGIGAKNVAAAERALDRAGIDVDGSDTGGESGRSVRFHPNSGEYIVERVDSETLTL